MRWHNQKFEQMDILLTGQVDSPSAQDTAYSIASPSARCSMADAKKTPAECYKLLQDGYIYIDVR